MKRVNLALFMIGWASFFAGCIIQTPIMLKIMLLSIARVVA